MIPVMRFYFVLSDFSPADLAFDRLIYYYCQSSATVSLHWQIAGVQIVYMYLWNINQSYY